MTTAGEAGTSPCTTSSVLVAPASLIGSELSVYMAPAYILSLAALFEHPPWRGLHFALLCVARDLGWCDHDYPRWGGHTLCHGQQNGPVLVTPASIIGSEFPLVPSMGLRPFALPHPDAAGAVLCTLGPDNPYIRNIIPGYTGIPFLGYRALSGWGYVRCCMRTSEDSLSALVRIHRRFIRASYYA
jgi:hypothetical protein